MKNLKIFSTLLFLLFISSMTFAQVKGSGNVEKDDSRKVGDFTKIHIATGIDGFIKLGDEINIELEFDVEEYEGECSSSFYIEELVVENYSYEINNENGILRIKI